MTVVLVHGVPESAAIWDEMLAEMNRDDVVAVSPPGFGAPLPDGFEPTSDGYRDWLVAEIEQLGGPVDLVGHDWGAGHALRATTARPELVRSLVTDIAGASDSNYVWHDMAQVWQTPSEGEAFVEAVASMPVEDRAQMLVDAGMTEAGARACADANGPTMGACILSLYRSAVQPHMSTWGDEFAALPSRPRTLVINAHNDLYTGGPDRARRVAQQWGASVAELDGLGHWWMMQDPARSAAMLSEFLG
ncbi:MAG: pimeloyl-ACP methyl ester carboxylesterase [Ilumatobacter sp.]